MFLKKKVDKSIDMPPNEWYYANIKRAEAQRKKERKQYDNKRSSRNEG